MSEEAFRPRRKSNAVHPKLTIQTRSSETNNDQLVINPLILDQVEKEHVLMSTSSEEGPSHRRTQSLILEDNIYDTILTSSSQKDNLDVTFSDAFEELEDTAKKDTITNKYLVDYDTKNLPKWKLILLCANCFFIVVATVLATGILAVPVKTAASGWIPFVLTFGLCLIAQIAVVIILVELLQRTSAVQDFQFEKHQQAEGLTKMEETWNNLDASHFEESPDFNQSNSSIDETMNVELQDQQIDVELEKELQGDLLIQSDSLNENGLPAQKKEDNQPKVRKNVLLSSGPDLHSVSRIFLKWNLLRFPFEFFVLLHFVTILVSNALACATSLSNLFGISDYFQLFIAPLVILFSLFIIFGYKIIQYVISLVTLLKLSLVIVMVVLVGVIGASSGRQIDNQFQYIGRTFLVGTVALGGTFNTLPFIYSKVKKPSRQTIRWFRFSAILALIICAIIQFVWTIFVLLTVPQFGEEPSLEYAELHGQISTTPIVDIIQRDFPQYKWLAILVDIFVIVSIIVSFVTIGTGFKHTVDGYSKSFSYFMNTEGTFLNRLALWLEKKSPKQFFTHHKLQPLCFQLFLYFLSFGLLLLIAQLATRQFFIIIEVFSSLAINLCCLFIAFMVFLAKRMHHKEPLRIPLPLHNYTVIVCGVIVVVYFSIAVFYDVVYHILKLFLELPF